MLLARLFARRDSRSPSLSLHHMHRPAAQRRRTHRPPHIEVLEDRTLLSGWVIDAVGTVDDPGQAIEVDASGNVYVTGNFAGTQDFDPGPGTFNLTSAGAGDVFVSKYSPAGSLIWARQFGSASTLGDDIGMGIAVDASGNVHVAGHFFATADFDPGPGTYNLTSAGNIDAFVSKLDASGNFLWARAWGGAGSDRAFGLALDSDGNPFTTGRFSGTADFDPGPGTYNLTSNGDMDIFVSKLDASGNLVWAARAGGSTQDGSGYNDRGRDIAVDSLGNLFVGGDFAGTADFGGTVLTSNGPRTDSFQNSTSLETSSGRAAPVAHLEGALLPGLAPDGSGGVYVTGGFSGQGDFGPFVLTNNGTSRDAFVAKLDSTGTFTWARQLGGGGDDLGWKIAADAAGGAYVTGSFWPTAADFDPGPGAAYLSTSSNGSEIFVAKLDSSGNFVSARRMGGTGNDNGNDIAVDSSGNIHVTGQYEGTADFDTGTSIVYLTATGGTDLFVVKTTQVIPTTPQLARLQDSPDPILNSGGTLTLTANDVRIVVGGSNVASVSFYRDKNSNGILDVGTDTLLGTDTDGSNGWSPSVTVSIPKKVKQATYTYFARAKDSANVAGNVVSTTNTIKKGSVAAMVTSRDVRQRGADAVIASHYFNNDDRENNLTLPDRLDRHTLRDLLRARRVR